MIKLVMYRGTFDRPNREAKGSFIKTFDTLEDYCAFIVKIWSCKTLWVANDNLSPAQRRAAYPKMCALNKKKYDAGRRNAHQQ